MALHAKCRNAFYPGTRLLRLTVNDDQVDWKISWDDYKPPYYESEKLKTAPYADPTIGDEGFRPNWNAQDGDVNRQSYAKKYEIAGMLPRNPMGRTGIEGRGRLGKWGPNHAADFVLCRWKVDVDGKVKQEGFKPKLEFLAIQRKDSGEYAIPGGMVDLGETESDAARREFYEEAFNSTNHEEHTKIMQQPIREVYRGYVDDVRNTDNAWMETVAFCLHDREGISRNMHFQAGDDAKNVQWIEADPKTKLYGSHSQIVKEVAESLGASWD